MSVYQGGKGARVLSARWLSIDLSEYNDNQLLAIKLRFTDILGDNSNSDINISLSCF